jgi:hypothetical protein
MPAYPFIRQSFETRKDAALDAFTVAAKAAFDAGARLMLSEGLWALLTETPSIVALIGTPDTRSDGTSGVFPVTMPERTPMPALVISQIAGGRDNVMEEPSGLRTARITFTAHGANYLQTKQLAKAVRDTLDGIKPFVPTAPRSTWGQSSSRVTPSR